MRTLNEDFSVGTDHGIRNKNFSYSYSSSSNSNNTTAIGHSNGYGYSNQHNSAIPYHARENSLPFSYGQIGKTSTPLKSAVSSAGANPSGVGTNGYRSYNDNGGGAGNGIDANYGLNSSYGRYGGGSDVVSDASTIKSQPRLKSPLLVRKTLNTSRSPTRGVTVNGTTNTIANTYPYSLGNTNGGRLSPTTNGNGLNSNSYGTPIRNDFEELLRERRDKVYNEYRTSSRQVEPLLPHSLPPPPRQFRGEDTTDAVYATPRHRKYNYDFEFNLNLDEDWLSKPMVPPQPPVRRTSSHAMEQYGGSNTYGKREQLQREQYRTRDIELPPMMPRDSDRNYHTINSSMMTTTTAAAANKEYERPPPQWRNEAATERFFETYEQRRQQTQSMPQPQRQQAQPQSIQRDEYTTTAKTTYGNGNAASYGYNSNYASHANHNSSNFSIHNSSNNNNMNESVVYRSSLGGAPAANLTSAPIYATTTKQVMKSAAYRNEPPLTITDYPSPTSPSTSANMASPTSATTTPSTPHFSRPETPAFPVTPRTPFGGSTQNGYSPTGRRLDHSISNGNQQYNSETIYQLTTPRPRLNSSFSVATSNAELQEVAAHLVKFAKDSSKFWYKPNLSRDEAISLLLNAAPGTFVVRDSTTYKNAYGLVVRVAQPPPNSNSTGKPDELVRHFLIEPTARGVRLKGCPNEPVFTSLSALVYEHSINQLALPCLLRIPEHDLVPSLIEPTPAQKQLLTQGAACNILWLYSCDTESLTGEEAIRKAIRQLYAQKPMPTPIEVHFKVSQAGITLTDNTRKKFFRKHYAADMISFCAIDPDHRLWTMQEPGAEGAADKNTVGALKKTIFAFVARRSPSSKDNQCHVFCDLAINQPASAIVAFANKTLPTERQRNFVL